MCGKCFPKVTFAKVSQNLTFLIPACMPVHAFAGSVDIQISTSSMNLCGMVCTHRSKDSRSLSCRIHLTQCVYIRIRHDISDEHDLSLHARLSVPHRNAVFCACAHVSGAWTWTKSHLISEDVLLMPR